MKTYLVLGSSSYESMWKYSASDACELFFAFKGYKSKILSYIRMIWLKNRFPAAYIWYRKIPVIADSRIIVFDEGMTIDYLKYLESNCCFENNRLIFYYWNLIGHTILNPQIIESNGYECWSFDKKDCELYNIKYNPQFFFKSWYHNNLIDAFLKNTSNTTDITFVGRDQYGRMKELGKKCEELKENGVLLDCYFTAHKWYKRFASREYKPYLDFKQMIIKECEGKAVLDYSISGQSGSTLRAYDALVNCRKVVTNNLDICDLPIYSKENVFILDRDKLEDLRAFLDAPFKEIDQKAIEECSEIGWLRRFG